MRSLKKCLSSQQGETLKKTAYLSLQIRQTSQFTRFAELE